MVDRLVKGIRVNRRIFIGLIVAVSVTSSLAAQDIGFTYASHSGILYRFDIPLGSTEPIPGGPLPGDIQGFTISSNGVIFGLSRNTRDLFSVDPETGATINHGTIDVGPDQFPIGLAFDGDGRLLMLANANPQSALYEIDPETATASFLLWIDSNEVGTFAISGTSCYALGPPPYGSLFSIDLSTGEASELSGAPMVYDLSFDGAGRLWGIYVWADFWSPCHGHGLVRFNLATGEYSRVTDLPDTNGCLFPLAILAGQPDSIPTQGPLGLTVFVLILGGLGIVFSVLRMGVSR
jgi:hypothetical protein